MDMDYRSIWFADQNDKQTNNTKFYKLDMVCRSNFYGSQAEWNKYFVIPRG